MEFIGIDVHKRESQVGIVAAGGEVVLEQRIRTEQGRFAELLGRRPQARILMEASTESEWAARCLEQLGHEVGVPIGTGDAEHFAKRVNAAKLPGHLMAEVAPLLVVMQQLNAQQ